MPSRARRLHRQFTGWMSPLDRIYDNDWVTRIWIYQEIMLAKNPVLVYGNTDIAWDSFMMATFYLRWSVDCCPWSVRSLSWEGSATGRTHIAKSSDSDITLDFETIKNYQNFVSGVLNTGFGITDICIGIIPSSFTHLKVYTVVKVFLTISSLVGVFACLAGSFALGTGMLVPVGLYFLAVLGLGTSGAKYVNKAVAVSDKTRLSSPVGHGVFLQVLIDTLYLRSASREEDYNYGIRAILGKLKGKSPPTPATGLSTTDIRRDLTVEILLHLSSLYPLMRAPLVDRSSKPSWVVDWSYKAGDIKFWHDYAVNACFESSYNATRGSVRGWIADPVNSGCLQVRRRVMGQVSELYTADDVDLVQHDWRRRIRPLLPRVSDYRNHRKHPDLPTLPKSAPEALRTFFPASLFDRKAWATLGKHMPSLGPPYEQSMLSYLRHGSLLPPFSTRFCDGLRDSQSALFTMKSDSDNLPLLAGITHEKTNIGDRVVLLAGVPIPMIMRVIDQEQNASAEAHANNQVMRLVSPAAIKDMMEGQYWSFGDEASLPYITIL